jgi:hypothetical protein
LAYFAIGLPIAILIRLFAGVPLFWFIVIPITILTFIGIAKMDETSILAARKFKDSKSIDSLAMAKKYYEEYRRRDEKYEYEHFCEQQKYFWKKIRREHPVTQVYLKDGTDMWCDYVTWNERLQEIHLRDNNREEYKVVRYEDIGSICVR